MANQTVPYTLPDGRLALNIDTSKTLAAIDCGIVQNIVADGITVTLPATVVGFDFTVRNGGAKINSSGPVGAVSDQSVGITVAPNSADQFQGGVFTAADNKAALDAKATAKIGDEIRIIGDGVNGWMFEYVKGNWTRQA